jgi:type IV pilus assembly protein PilM
MKLPWKRDRSPTGLDCGQSWAKLVGFQRTRQGVVLHKIGRMPWTVQDKEKPRQMAEHLSTLYSELQIPAGEVITSLAGHSVIIKRLNLPVHQARDLPDSLPGLAAQHIPFEAQDVCLDYQTLAPDQESGETTVLLVASKKKMVHERQWVMSQAGLETRIIDVDGFALCNCFAFNYPEMQDTPCALLDIGANQSTFCVVHGENPLFIRDAGFGGQQITDRLVHALDLPGTQAETLKWQSPDNLSPEIRTTLDREMQAAFIAWTEEIQRLLHYYAGSLADTAPRPQTLYLSGGGSLHPGLTDILHEYLDFETAFLDPWRQCRVQDSPQFDPGYLQSLGPQYAVAAGLALRGVI